MIQGCVVDKLVAVYTSAWNGMLQVAIVLLLCHFTWTIGNDGYLAFYDQSFYRFPILFLFPIRRDLLAVTLAWLYRILLGSTCRTITWNIVSSTCANTYFWKE